MYTYFIWVQVRINQVNLFSGKQLKKLKQSETEKGKRNKTINLEVEDKGSLKAS